MCSLPGPRRKTVAKGGESTGKKFYLYERKPGAWYVRHRSKDGTIRSPVRAQDAETREDAIAWAAKHLSDVRTVRKPTIQTSKQWAAPWWKPEL